jgi:hypothetical protein
MLQPQANVGLDCLQNFDINVLIKASRAAPIAGHAHVREPETIRLWFEQQHSDIYELLSHYVRDIPQYVEIELLQISHRHPHLFGVARCWDIFSLTLISSVAMNLQLLGITKMQIPRAKKRPSE